jgi:hypothetical protein
MSVYYLVIRRFGCRPSRSSSRNVRRIFIILNDDPPRPIILTFLTYPRLDYPYPTPNSRSLSNRLRRAEAMSGDDVRPLSAGESRDEEDHSDTKAKCTRGEDIGKEEVCSSGQLECCQSVFPANHHDGVIVIVDGVVGVRRLSRRLGPGWYDDTGSLHRPLRIN